MAKRYFIPEDLLDHHWLSGLTVHSDSTIAYVDRSIDRETNSYHTAIKTISNSISETIPGEGFDSLPSWSPEGSLTFLRGKEKKAIWMLDVQGNAAQLVDYPASILSYQWSPDGSHLLFTASIHADHKKQLNTDQRGHVYEQVYFKQEGTGSYSGAYNHLFLFRLADNSIVRKSRYKMFIPLQFKIVLLQNSQIRACRLKSSLTMLTNKPLCSLQMIKHSEAVL
ncbi:hypothetical protein SAMN05421503_0354 [Terribacillus aidingensis]|uniref:WD40-like Beta Propeller Repeat n=1 Tax=Terribacillus aidingensis TaxID=586416 RepID=A0A285N254_9BACI|nr:hypothetical protein [Terribacillus aidingensis]SNZ03408.1 hypothetical protein SAMN05421503_0354 [Terribacillus aidingensis]